MYQVWNTLTIIILSDIFHNFFNNIKSISNNMKSLKDMSLPGKKILQLIMVLAFIISLVGVFLPSVPRPLPWIVSGLFGLCTSYIYIYAVKTKQYNEFKYSISIIGVLSILFFIMAMTF